MRLPGTEEWSNEDIGAQIAFELKFAKNEPLLRDVFDTVTGRGDTSRNHQYHISESIFARGRAAEFAFATENVSGGTAICMQIVANERPRTPMGIAFYAVVGAVVGAVHVRLTAEGAFVQSPSQAIEDFRVAWPRDDSAYAVALMRHFLPAAAASGPLRQTTAELFEQQLETMKPQIMSAFGTSIELQALFSGMSADAFPTLERLRPLLLMEANYAARLSLMRSDRYHWSRLEPKGAIIDWPLLCIWLSLLRFNGFTFVEHGIQPRSDDAAFIRWLGQVLKTPIARPQPPPMQPL
jgi:hypothetical protein